MHEEHIEKAMTLSSSQKNNVLLPASSAASPPSSVRKLGSSFIIWSFHLKAVKEYQALA